MTGVYVYNPAKTHTGKIITAALAANRIYKIPENTGTTPAFMVVSGTKKAWAFDTTATAPSNSGRLNFDGYLYATRFC